MTARAWAFIGLFVICAVLISPLIHFPKP